MEVQVDNEINCLDPTIYILQARVGDTVDVVSQDNGIKSHAQLLFITSEAHYCVHSQAIH